MPPRVFRVSVFFCLLAALSFTGGLARGSDADTIGATALQQADPALTGAGVAVIQAEASLTAGTSAATDTFETNPASAGLPPGIMTYVNYNGSVAASFTNSIGLESWHADAVAGNIAAIAPGISSLDNYDAQYYYNNVVAAGQLPASLNSALHNAQIVNQSFIFTGITSADAAQIDRAYDSYAAANNVLFISGAGNNPGLPQPPSTAYNGLCVNAYSLSPSTSASPGGRSLPDITAPGSETSYSTADVTGAAALLLQAADGNAGGPGTASAASDIRTLKALLLNGATKPAGWSHTSTQPLDPVYGAGMVNVYNSWQELSAGQQTAAASSGANSSMPTPASLLASAGWDLGSLPNGATTNHYFFTAPAASGGSDTLAATITWNVANWDSSNNAIMNNLDLALYDTADPLSLVSISDSTVDNVQQLFVTGLVPGDTYDLRVYDAASPINGGSETYGLAYSVANPAVAAVPEPSTIFLLAAAPGVRGGGLPKAKAAACQYR